jgi:hypothetical protein
MSRYFCWRLKGKGVQIVGKAGFEAFLDKWGRDKFPAFLVSTSVHETIIENTSDEKRLRKDLYFYGFDSEDSDTINHFGPRDETVMDFLRQLSPFLTNTITFLVTDKEFPVIDSVGYAWLVEVGNNELSIMDLVLVNKKEWVVPESMR